MSLNDPYGAGGDPNAPPGGAGNIELANRGLGANNNAGDPLNSAGNASARPGDASGDAAAPAQSAAAVEENKAAAPSQIVVNPMREWHPQLVRSYMLPNNDRYILEQEHMQPLRAGSGILGTGLVDLDDLKRDLLPIPEEKKLQRNKDMLENLRLDGIYVDDPEVYGKFTDINVQKLEERLLRNKQAEFFKMNGELKLDNDILDGDLTRPADLAFE